MIPNKWMQERTYKRAWKELKTNDVMLIVQVLNVTMKQNCIPKRIFSVQTVLATSPRRLCRFSTLDYKVTRLILCNPLFIYLFLVDVRSMIFFHLYQLLTMWVNLHSNLALSVICFVICFVICREVILSTWWRVQGYKWVFCNCRRLPITRAF